MESFIHLYAALWHQVSPINCAESKHENLACTTIICWFVNPSSSLSLWIQPWAVRHLSISQSEWQPLWWLGVMVQWVSASNTLLSVTIFVLFGVHSTQYLHLFVLVLFTDSLAPVADGLQGWVRVHRARATAAHSSGGGCEELKTLNLLVSNIRTKPWTRHSAFQAPTSTRGSTAKHICTHHSRPQHTPIGIHTPSHSLKLSSNP